MGKEGERRGEVTEEQETPSRVWAGLHIRQNDASIKPFMLSQRNVESLERSGSPALRVVIYLSEPSSVFGVCFKQVWGSLRLRTIFPPYFNSR